jgi:hypothetical protein
MSQKAVTPNGTVTVPGGYGSATVISTPSGFGTTGVVAVFGESSDGLSFADEATLGLNTFGPDQDAAIRAKYGTGPLVDALLIAASPSADPDIVGAPALLVPVKTNRGTPAGLTLPSWGVAKAASTGKAGNSVALKIEATPETPPATPGVLFCPPQVSTVVDIRVSGADAVTATVGVGELPSALASAIDGLAGVAATGGVNRAVITSIAGTMALVLDSGFQCHFTISTAWANRPSVGDLLYVPTGSPFQAVNEGSWVVTAATANRIDAYKLRDAAGSGSACTQPVGEVGISVAATTDLQAFSPIVVSVNATATRGIGQSLEIADSGSASFAATAFLGTPGASPPAIPYTGISTTASPALLISSVEASVKATVSQVASATQESVVTGGEVAFAIGYTGADAMISIAAGTMTAVVTGGSGAGFTVSLGDYATVGDLADYIDSLTGWIASPGSPTTSSVSPVTLDAGVYTASTAHGVATARIKADAAKAVADFAGLPLVSIAATASGLPAALPMTYLSGGTRGGTSNTDILNALTALERVRCNFVVAAFDSDASADVAAGITDSASTYDIASIGANLKSHVAKMSGFKRRRNRQGFIGTAKGVFADRRQFAASLASADLACAFQPIRATDATGTLRTLGPKAAGALIAGMQAAAGYRPIVDRLLDISGVMPVSGFDPEADTDVATAIDSGLLVLGANEEGGFKTIIDQTTWVRDDNFVFNSVGNVYNKNVLLVGFFQRMQKLFNGRSVADVGAGAALTGAEQYLKDAFAAKLIAASDQYPPGYGKLKVRLAPPAMFFSATAVLSTGILFEVVDLQIVPANQTAG